MENNTAGMIAPTSSSRALGGGRKAVKRAGAPKKPAKKVRTANNKKRMVAAAASGPKVHLYRMKHDNPHKGRAPNLLRPALTMASCKPVTKAIVKVGDIIVGLAGAKLAPASATAGGGPWVIFVAEVTEALSKDAYMRRVQSDPLWAGKAAATGRHRDILNAKARQVLVSRTFYHWRSGPDGEVLPEDRNRLEELPSRLFPTAAGDVSDLNKIGAGVPNNYLANLPHDQRDFLLSKLLEGNKSQVFKQ